MKPGEWREVPQSLSLKPRSWNVRVEAPQLSSCAMRSQLLGRWQNPQPLEPTKPYNHSPKLLLARLCGRCTALVGKYGTRKPAGWPICPNSPDTSTKYSLEL